MDIRVLIRVGFARAIVAEAVMHEIHVSVVSTEDGSDGVAEFWSDGRMIAFTRYEENDLMLRIEPRHDGAPIMFGAHAMAAALAEATRLLAAY